MYLTLLSGLFQGEERVFESSSSDRDTLASFGGAFLQRVVGRERGWRHARGLGQTELHQEGGVAVGVARRRIVVRRRMIRQRGAPFDAADVSSESGEGRLACREDRSLGGRVAGGGS